MGCPGGGSRSSSSVSRRRVRPGQRPRSRWPLRSPHQIAGELEERIVELRKELTDQGLDAGAHTIAFSSIGAMDRPRPSRRSGGFSPGGLHLPSTAEATKELVRPRGRAEMGLTLDPPRTYQARGKGWKDVPGHVCTMSRDITIAGGVGFEPTSGLPR